MVLTAHHVRDPHVAVVDRDGEVVERAAVRAPDHEVLDRRVRRRDVAEHGIRERDLTLVGHAEAHRALVLVGLAGGEQPAHGLLVRVTALPLRERALVPVELEPAQRLQDLLHVLGVERSRSVSSIRRTNRPPEPRARSQL